MVPMVRILQMVAACAWAAADSINDCHVVSVLSLWWNNLLNLSMGSRLLDSIAQGRQADRNQTAVGCDPKAVERVGLMTWYGHRPYRGSPGNFQSLIVH